MFFLQNTVCLPKRRKNMYLKVTSEQKKSLGQNLLNINELQML